MNREVQAELLMQVKPTCNSEWKQHNTNEKEGTGWCRDLIRIPTAVVNRSHHPLVHSLSHYGSGTIQCLSSGNSAVSRIGIFVWLTVRESNRGYPLPADK